MVAGIGVGAVTVGRRSMGWMFNAEKLQSSDVSGANESRGEISSELGYNPFGPGTRSRRASFARETSRHFSRASRSNILQQQPHSSTSTPPPLDTLADYLIWIEQSAEGS